MNSKNYEYDYLLNSKGYHPIKLVRSKGIKSFSSVVKLNTYPGSISILERFLCRENTILKYSGGPLHGDIGKYLAYITIIASRRRVSHPYLRLPTNYSIFFIIQYILIYVFIKNLFRLKTAFNTLNLFAKHM